MVLPILGRTEITSLLFKEQKQKEVENVFLELSYDTQKIKIIIQCLLIL